LLTTRLVGTTGPVGVSVAIVSEIWSCPSSERSERVRCAVRRRRATFAEAHRPASSRSLSLARASRGRRQGQTRCEDRNVQETMGEATKQDSPLQKSEPSTLL
jgi:hypothetical protein